MVGHVTSMKANDVSRALKIIDSNTSRAARLLKTGRSTIYRWKSDGVGGAVNVFLQLVLDGTISAKDVERVNGLDR